MTLDEKYSSSNNIVIKIQSTDSYVYNKDNFYNEPYIENPTQNYYISNNNNSNNESTYINTKKNTNNSVTITDNICNICILKNKKICYPDEYCQIINIKDFNDYLLKIYSDTDSKINYIMELRDERLLICNLDYLIKIIEIDYKKKTYKFTNILRGHSNLITNVIELKNGKLCSCSFDGYIKLWKKKIDNSYEFEMNLKLFENGKFYSILEVNEIIFSLLNYDNKNILYFINLNTKKEGKKILENINLKRENLIQFDNNNLIIGGIKVIYIYEINNNKEIEIKCDYIICSLYLLKDNVILFGDNSGKLLKIINIFNNFEIKLFKEDEIKEEINSLVEFDNGNKYFIFYKNKNYQKKSEIEIKYN